MLECMNVHKPERITFFTILWYTTSVCTCAVIELYLQRGHMPVLVHMSKLGSHFSMMHIFFLIMCASTGSGQTSVRESRVADLNS